VRGWAAPKNLSPLRSAAGSSPRSGPRVLSWTLARWEAALDEWSGAIRETVVAWAEVEEAVERLKRVSRDRMALEVRLVQTLAEAVIEEAAQ
jgi:hypothetical protein